MSAKDNGGYAYPQTPAIGPAGDLYHPSEQGWGGGMTLRDYFAGQATQSRVDFPNTKKAAEFAGMAEPDDGDVEAYARLSAAIQAKLAYIYADAMLAERSK